MILKEKTLNGVPVLSLSGKVDIFSKNALKETAEKYMEMETKGLILDVQGVTFLDSVGLGALAMVAKAFQKLKGRVIVVNPPDQVKNSYPKCTWNISFPCTRPTNIFLISPNCNLLSLPMRYRHLLSTPFCPSPPPSCASKKPAAHFLSFD